MLHFATPFEAYCEQAQISFAKSFESALVKRVEYFANHESKEVWKPAVEFASSSSNPEIRAIFARALRSKYAYETVRRIALSNPHQHIQSAQLFVEFALETCDLELLFAFGSDQVVPEMLKQFAASKPESQASAIERLCRSNVPKPLVGLAGHFAMNSGSERASDLAAMVRFMNDVDAGDRFLSICVHPPTRKGYLLDEFAKKLASFEDENVVSRLKYAIQPENGATIIWRQYALRALLEKGVNDIDLRFVLNHFIPLLPELDEPVSKMISAQKPPLPQLSDFIRKSKTESDKRDVPFPAHCLLAYVMVHPELGMHTLSLLDNKAMSKITDEAYVNTMLNAGISSPTFKRLPVLMSESQWSLFVARFSQRKEEVSPKFATIVARSAIQSSRISYDSFCSLLEICENRFPEASELLRESLDSAIVSERVGSLEYSYYRWALVHIARKGSTVSDNLKESLFLAFLSCGDERISEILEGFSPDISLLRGAKVCPLAFSDRKYGEWLRNAAFTNINSGTYTNALTTLDDVQAFYGKTRQLAQAGDYSLHQSGLDLILWQDYGKGLGRMLCEIFAQNAKNISLDLINDQLLIALDGDKPRASDDSAASVKSLNRGRWAVNIDLKARQFFDSDKDGIPDDIEINVLGTDPASQDSDKDGLLDGHDPDPLVAGNSLLPIRLYAAIKDGFVFPGSLSVSGLIHRHRSDSISSLLASFDLPTYSLSNDEKSIIFRMTDCRFIKSITVEESRFSVVPN